MQVLECPCCRAPLSVQEYEPGWGVARCPCGPMPLAAGVLMADRGEREQQILDALEARDYSRARAMVLERFARRTQWMESLGMRVTFRRYVRHTALHRVVETLKIRKLLERMPPARLGKNLAAAAQFNGYIRHRFSAPWTLGMVGLLGLLEGRDGLVLDAPCGMGHLAHRIAKLIEQQRIVCMDLLSGFVYSTRRFFVPEALATITYDMNKPLPLADGRFAMIFCFDSFQHMHDKAQTARDFMRILNDDGVLVIGRSPNRFYPHLYSDRALSPAEHVGLFSGYAARVYPEGYLVDQYLSGNPIDLSRRFSQEELDRARNIDVVVGKSESVFGLVPNISTKLLEKAANPQLNPLYRVRHRSGQLELELFVPEALAEEYGRFPQILPKRVTVDQRDVRRENGRLHFANARELLEKHVLEDLPADY